MCDEYNNKDIININNFIFYVTENINNISTLIKLNKFSSLLSVCLYKL